MFLHTAERDLLRKAFQSHLLLACSDLRGFTQDFSSSWLILLKFKLIKDLLHLYVYWYAPYLHHLGLNLSGVNVLLEKKSVFIRKLSGNRVWLGLNMNSSYIQPRKTKEKL